jgi:hypothetical protein
LLTNVSNVYMPQGIVSEQVLPNLSVKEMSGLIGKYGTDHLRVQNTLMGGRGEARRVEVITRSSDTYLIEDHGLEGVVTENDYRNVEQPFEAESDETQGLTSALYVGKEVALAQVMGSTSILTQNTTLSGGNQFSDYINSNPLTVTKTAFNTVKDGCGLAPNACVMSWKVYNTLKYHPAILEALGFAANRAGLLSREDIAKALDVKYLYVAEGSYESAKKGQSSSLAEIWGKDMIFYVRPDAASKYQVSLGYYITKAGQGPRAVYKSALDNPPGSTRIIVMDSYDMVITNAKAAYLIEDAIA